MTDVLYKAGVVIKVLLKVALAVTVGLCAFCAKVVFGYMCGGRR